MAHYLFTLWDGGGSLPPELSLARQLIEAGHEVTVLSEPVAEEEVLAIGAGFRSWVDAPHKTDRADQDQHTADWSLKTPGALLGMLLDDTMVGPAPIHAAETLEAIDAVGADAVVSSFTLFGAQMAAESRGLPNAMLVPNPLTLPVEGMPPFGLGLQPATGAAGRLRDRTLNRVIEHYWNKSLDQMNEIRATLGLAPLDRLLAAYEQTDRLLVLTSEAFDFPAAVPENVRYVGPQLDDPAWSDPWTPPADERPLVLVGLSTTYMGHTDLLQRIADGLGQLPVRGLITTGPAVDPSEIAAPDNVEVVRSAPHTQVLEHAAVLVTHGGHGTLLKGLVAGVPIVCIPLGRDQPDNAARLVARGAGTKLGKKASAADVAKAVQLLLDDPSYREAAVALGTVIAEDAARGLGLTELEGLVQQRNGASTSS